jgi:hypothetical protein
MPVILASWETEIGRMMVPSQLCKKFTDPHLNRKTWVWQCMSVTPTTTGSINRRNTVHTGPGKNWDSYLQNKQGKWTGSLAQPVERLTDKCEVLTLNPSNTKKKKKRIKKSTKEMLIHYCFTWCSILCC